MTGWRLRFGGQQLAYAWKHAQRSREWSTYARAEEREQQPRRSLHEWEVQGLHETQA